MKLKTGRHILAVAGMIAAVAAVAGCKPGAAAAPLSDQETKALEVHNLDPNKPPAGEIAAMAAHNTGGPGPAGPPAAASSP
jgi:hypothetical protein